MDACLPLIIPKTIPRAEHSISRSQISPNAVKVLYRLHKAGFRACLVGGGVRDLLLGIIPKDFDVTTDATPEQVRQLFRNCRLIGRRFRLAHVQFGREIIEVATFRAAEEQDDSAELFLRYDNYYGNIEDDAQRRDFSVNALYYDINDFSLLDYVGGLDDLNAGVIRIIGEPERRYQEDPVRMLRAIRFAAKLGFRIEPATEAPIYHMAYLLRQVPPARLFDEILKLFITGHAVQSFELLRLYGLLQHILPLTARSLRKNRAARLLLSNALANTDQRIAEDKPVTPAFLYAALLWAPLCDRMQRLSEHNTNEQEVLHQAADELIRQQSRHTSMPRRFSAPMREIWALQARFTRRTGKRAHAFLNHPRFRAAYDFLVLRAQSGEPVEDLADWWTEVQNLSETERQQRFKLRKPRRSPTTRPAHSALN